MRVHIITSRQTLQYHDYCVNNLKSLAHNPEDINVTSHCMDEDSFNHVISKGGTAVSTAGGSGSVGHASGIVSFLSSLEKGKINILSDSDCLMLVRGWDSILTDLIKDYGVVGATYEDIGGFSSGDADVQTYKRLPNASWLAFSPDYSWDFDPMCDKGNSLLIDSQELSETFNLPIGKSLFREPMWQLPVYIRKNSIKSYPLKFIRPTSGLAKAVQSGEDYHTEYQLEDGTPFLAHQRGSLSKAFRQHHLSRTFYDACESYIRNL